MQIIYENPNFFSEYFFILFCSLALITISTYAWRFFEAEIKNKAGALLVRTIFIVGGFLLLLSIMGDTYDIPRAIKHEYQTVTGTVTDAWERGHHRRGSFDEKYTTFVRIEDSMNFSMDGVQMTNLDSLKG